ncbi:MAG: carboxylesterase family protein [Eubacteriaceae bacterium]|nr:carboxylesterase family protein [Eubacteriaceae bacterium]
MIRQVKIEGGEIRGIPAADPRVTAFKGVPFAAPPVGENRWRAPQPVIPWEGVKECYTFAPISMQHIPGLDLNNIYSREWNVDPSIPMSEDCLYLNVWTPAKTPDEKLPVLVWFFGGGLREGNTAEMEFDGERIARRGVVVVTVNYRLNVFGFFAHPQLTKEQPDAPANFGHLDQQAGIKWAIRNIAAFGGDPTNITIGGQSAGGGSVVAQLTSPQNVGLFQKAIIMSGMSVSLYNQRPLMDNSFEAIQKRGVEFFDYLGVKTLEEARKIDEVTLRDKCEAFGGFWGTANDGVFQVGNSSENLQAGRRMDVPLMIGNTSSEFKRGCGAKTLEELKKVAEGFGDKADEFMKIVGTDPVKAEEITAVNGVQIAVRALKRNDEKNGIKSPIYYYVFDPEIPGWDNPGTFHSSDLWFFFETLAKCWRPFVGKHYDLARQMCNSWAYFFKNGDPNGNDANGEPMPEWKPFTTAEPNTMRWGDAPDPFVYEPDAITQFLVDDYCAKIK